MIGRAEGEVGHEVPVHHVHVDPLGAAGDRLLDLLAQPAEVGAQHARRDPGAHRRTCRTAAHDQVHPRAPRGRPFPGDGRVAMHHAGLRPAAPHGVHPSDPDPRGLDDLLGPYGSGQPHDVGHGDRRRARAQHQLHDGVGRQHHARRRDPARAPRRGASSGWGARRLDPRAGSRRRRARVFASLPAAARARRGSPCRRRSTAPGVIQTDGDARSPRTSVSATRPRSRANRPPRRRAQRAERRLRCGAAFSSGAPPEPGREGAVHLVPLRQDHQVSLGRRAGRRETSRSARAGTRGAAARNRSTCRSFSSGSIEQVA